MLQMLQSQNYGLQQLTKLEGSMCTQKTMKGEKWNTTQSHSNIYYVLTLK
jgi:hypothetical protein